MYAKTRKQHLERSFRQRDAIHASHQRDNADFTGCPRLPVHDINEYYLSTWRKTDWRGTPGRQIALSLDNETLLWAYRRIWGTTPTFIDRETGDFPISATELYLIAYHVYGYRREEGGPPMKQVVMEVFEGPFS